MRRSALVLATALLAVTSTAAVTTEPSEPPPLIIVVPAPDRPRTKSEPPPPPRATLSEPLTAHPYWVQRDIENQIALLFGARSDVLFLGDSITDLLARGDGKQLWDALYAPLGALNFGIGGIRTSHVLWQIEAGQVTTAAPKVVVLLIGSNNLAENEPPAEVAAGVEKIITELQTRLPDTRVLLLGILPRGPAADDPLRAPIAETNRLLAELGDDDRVVYLDLGGYFVDPDGAIWLLLMPDTLHPNYWGYFVYTVVIWEKLMALVILSEQDSGSGNGG